MHEAQSVLCSDLNSALLRDAKRTLAALLDEDFRKKYPQLQQRAKEFGKALGALELDAQCRVDVDPDNPNKFCVRSEARDLWMKADDEGTTTEWVSALRAGFLLVS